MSDQSSSDAAGDKTLFEKIIARDLPGDIVYEDETVVAFRDINPAAPTHLLIVPREPVPSLQQISDDHEAMLGRLLLVATKLARQEGLDAGYRCVINTGDDGGQLVPHLHLHLIGGTPLGTSIATN